MDGLEFRAILTELGLTQTEAARLLSTNDRTVRRWAEGNGVVPPPVERALIAWRRLNRFGLPWRPDEILLSELDEDEVAKQILLLRNHVVGLDDILERVRQRGGPAAPWKVNLKKREANLRSIEIGFYAMSNGNFSPSTYRRKDGPPDLERDRFLIEDAYACIASEIAKVGPDWVNDAN
ncbi:MAG TPA: hypothetical protein VHX92_08435 [Rhizomicrobium sp.]|jgi:transcriptional regulator with XRE-family HTH domain|nr:hypothetical protein [Rhizomicrobium sp.]